MQACSQLLPLLTHQNPGTTLSPGSCTRASM